MSILERFGPVEKRAAFEAMRRIKQNLFEITIKTHNKNLRKYHFGVSSVHPDKSISDDHLRGFLYVVGKTVAHQFNERKGPRISFDLSFDDPDKALMSFRASKSK